MKPATIAAAVLLLVLASCSSEEATPPDAEKLNFLVLFVDDLGWTDLAVYGSDLYQTPAIDQLASDGVRFTNAYSACTVCSPSRAALMTGKYPARTRVTDWIRGYSRPHAKLKIPDWTMKLEQRHTSLAEALGAAGYKTAIVGKWHLMPAGEPDQNDFMPTRHGFDVNIGGNEYGSPPSYFHPYERAGRTLGPMPPGGQDGDYLTDRLTDEALKLIDQWKAVPFFLYFAYYNVHAPIMAKDEDIARFEPLIKPGMRHTDATYAGMVASVDRSVGRLRAKLDELGVADKTVIIFTSDNGGLDRDGSGHPTKNKPLRAGKGSAYEGGVRVPAIVYWPGVTPRGGASNEPIITMDYYPTILSMAGASGSMAGNGRSAGGDANQNSEIDGLNLVPLLRDPSGTLERDAIYWHYPHYHSQGATPYSAVREGNLRLVEFLEDGHVELYNLKADIGETKDLVKEMPEKAAELTEKLHAWRESVGAQMPSENPDYDPRNPNRTE